MLCFDTLMHESQNRQIHSKYLAAFATVFIKCFWPFWDVMDERVKYSKKCKKSWTLEIYWITSGFVCYRTPSRPLDTAWKVLVFGGFLVRISRIQLKCGKIRTRKTLNMDTQWDSLCQNQLIQLWLPQKFRFQNFVLFVIIKSIQVEFKELLKEVLSLRTFLTIVDLAEIFHSNIILLCIEIPHKKKVFILP